MIRFTLKKEQIEPVIALCSIGIDAKSTNQLHSGLQVAPDKDSSRLYFEVNTADIKVKTNIGCDKIESSGRFIINFQIFSSVMNKFSSGDDLVFEIQDDSPSNLSLCFSSGKFNLNVNKISDSTEIDDEYSHTIKVSPVVCQEFVEHTIFCSSNDETRYFLTGSFINVENVEGDKKELIVVATDGHRLGFTKNEIEIVEHNNEIEQLGLIAHKKTSQFIKHLADLQKKDNAKNKDKDNLDKDITIKLGSNSIRVFSGQTEFISKVIDGKFPDYSKAIPVNNSIQVKVNCLELKKAIKRVSGIVNGNSKGIRLKFSSDNINLSFTNDSHETATEGVVAEVAIDDFEIGFNYVYFSDILDSIKSDLVTIMLSDTSSPVKIFGNDEDRHFYILMPLRI